MFGFMETANDGRLHIAADGVIVVASPFVIGTHHGDGVKAVLTTKGLRECDGSTLA